MDGKFLNRIGFYSIFNIEYNPILFKRIED